MGVHLISSSDFSIARQLHVTGEKQRQITITFTGNEN